MRTVLLLLILLVQSAYAQTSAECYPGLICPAAPNTTFAPRLTGDAISGLSATPNFVVDTANGLVWSRELFALGTTKDRFSAAYMGVETYVHAYKKVRQDAQAQVIGGAAGWRLATSSEVDALMARMAPATLYLYFRTHRAIAGPSNVIGAMEPAPNLYQVPCRGVQHANTIQGPYGVPGRPLGLPEINTYGFWLVQPLAPALDAATRAAVPLREIFEPVEEFVLSPLETFQPKRTGSAFEMVASSDGVALVDSTRGAQTRFVALYNFKPAPRGALVSMELLVNGLESSGAPAPLVEVSIRTQDRADLSSPEDLWNCGDAAPVGVWRFPNSVKLMLPDPPIGNAYRGEELLYACFIADYNTVRFQWPPMIIRYVREANVLTNRESP